MIFIGVNMLSSRMEVRSIIWWWQILWVWSLPFSHSRSHGCVGRRRLMLFVWVVIFSSFPFSLDHLLGLLHPIWDHFFCSSATLVIECHPFPSFSGYDLLLTMCPMTLHGMQTFTFQQHAKVVNFWAARSITFQDPLLDFTSIYTKLFSFR